MKKPKTTEFQDPIFRWDVIAQRGGTLKDFYSKFGKWLKRDDMPVPEYNPGGFAHFVFAENIKGLGLWFHERSGAGAITHECIHAANHVCRETIGNVTSKNEEFVCYYADYLARELVERLW